MAQAATPAEPTAAVGTEVLFYHLDKQPLDQVLPTLIERTLERGWRAVIQAGSTERVEAIDALLWTFRENSFVPHGLASDAHAARHPVLLTTEETNPNGAAVRFLVDGASLADWHAPYTRIVLMFDGSDQEALQRARADWKRVKAAGLAATYWQQSPQGKWERKA